MMRDLALFDAGEPRSGSAGADLPFRDRDVFPHGAVFGPSPVDGCEILVAESAITAMREATRDRRPHETMGWLMGRAFQDRHGPFVVVTGAVHAERSSSGPGHIRLSPDEIAALRRRATIANPMDDQVGWWHSHPRPSEFSSVDRDEQRTWPGPLSVGIVTFMSRYEGEPWGLAYRGQASEPLRLQPRLRPAALDPRVNGARESRADRDAPRQDAFETLDHAMHVELDAQPPESMRIGPAPRRRLRPPFMRWVEATAVAIVGALFLALIAVAIGPVLRMAGAIVFGGVALLGLLLWIWQDLMRRWRRLDARLRQVEARGTGERDDAALFESDEPVESPARVMVRKEA